MNRRSIGLDLAPEISISGASFLVRDRQIGCALELLPDLNLKHPFCGRVTVQFALSLLRNAVAKETRNSRRG
jgi:hypothetical protein